MEYLDIQKSYDELKEESKIRFKENHGNEIFRKGMMYKNHDQTYESHIVKKAKLIISKYYNQGDKFFYNEISARKGKECGAPVIDLYDSTHLVGIELHWQTKKLQHSKMIPRILRYKEIFGECILVLLSYGVGNAWKRKQGITYLKEETLKRYKESGIKVIFFNIDEPNFEWLE